MVPTIINPQIFKAYDIRALVGKEINREVAYKIGRALITHTKAKKIVVGQDMRPSSLEIEDGLVNGILDQGADVIRVGMVSTPIIYYASWNLAVDAAVIVTASHNPVEWNGMKFCYKDAVPIGEGSGMEEIRDLAIQGQFSNPEQRGTIEENTNLKEKYFDYVASFFKKGLNKRKIIIDFANGMGIVEKPIFERINEDVTAEYMYDELDGNFPNHEANPLKTETLADLQKAVVEKGADLGISYDGDADRVGFVDEKGQIVPMDFPIALLGKEILKKQPGALTLIDLRSSNAIGESLEKAGGRIGRCRVGHSLIKKQMKEEGAVFAGELSGHYFFEENSKAEMTTLAILLILNLLNETGRTMSDLADELRVYFQSGEINSEVENKNAVMEELKEKYADGKLNELDGIRIDFADWWFNVRPSNTEPVLRLNLEAKTKALMEQKRDEILKIIRK